MNIIALDHNNEAVSLNYDNILYTKVEAKKLSDTAIYVVLHYFTENSEFTSFERKTYTLPDGSRFINLNDTEASELLTLFLSYDITDVKMNPDSYHCTTTPEILIEERLRRVYY